jgi:hypothetical protein
VKRLAPHLLIFSAVLVLAAVGFATNSPTIGRILGSWVGLAGDPISSSAALVSGAVVLRYTHMLALAVVAGIIMSVAIIWSLSGWWASVGYEPNLTTDFIERMLVFLILAHLAHAARTLLSPNR